MIFCVSSSRRLITNVLPSCWPVCSEQSLFTSAAEPDQQRTNKCLKLISIIIHSIVSSQVFVSCPCTCSSLLVFSATVATLHPKGTCCTKLRCVFYCVSSDGPAEVGFACNGKVRSLEFWNDARIMLKLLLMEPSSFLSCLAASRRCVVTFSLQTFSNKASDERFTTELSCFVSVGNQKWGQELYLSE